MRKPRIPCQLRDWLNVSDGSSFIKSGSMLGERNQWKSGYEPHFTKMTNLYNKGFFESVCMSGTGDHAIWLQGWNCPQIHLPTHRLHSQTFNPVNPLLRARGRYSQICAFLWKFYKTNVQVIYGPRHHPGVQWQVQVQGGILQTWSHGCLRRNSSGRWGPYQERWILCLDLVLYPQEP